MSKQSGAGPLISISGLGFKPAGRDFKSKRIKSFWLVTNPLSKESVLVDICSKVNVHTFTSIAIGAQVGRKGQLSDIEDWQIYLNEADAKADATDRLSRIIEFFE